MGSRNLLLNNVVNFSAPIFLPVMTLALTIEIKPSQ
jgi:hypothetical protein